MSAVARIAICLLVSMAAAGCAFETENDSDAHLAIDDESFVEDDSLDEFAPDDHGPADDGQTVPSYGDEVVDEIVEMPPPRLPPSRLGADASGYGGEDEDNPEPQPWRLDATSDNPEPQPWDELSHHDDNPEPQPWEDDVAESDQNPEPQPWRSSYAAAERGTSSSTSSSDEPTPQPW